MQRAGSTTQIAANFDAIQAYVAGKTIAELEAAVEGKEAAEFVGAVSGATLADSLGYVKGVIEAAKAAGTQTGTYTVYNKTGETVTCLQLVDNVTGEKGVNYAGAGIAADACVVITKSMAASEDGNHHLTLHFETESGYAADFATLSIEVVPLNLPATDAMTGATLLTFFAPAE